MNTNGTQENVPRFEKLAKPKERIDRTSNYNAFNVKPEALSYQITDSLNKLAQPKRKQVTNTLSASSSLRSSSNTVRERQKLINSNEQSKDALESKKKKFLLDTYARIVAARNKRCSKRLHELAKPRNPSIRNESYEDYDNYFQTIKKYNAKSAALKRNMNQ
ncbi:uncharacterized protein LOC114875223 [Osmia bicornis bicornis]|uniref:uncharacterized protein LOC114875223 n=1 Tax=Osmia bicornis bicornis TaxID=1437191 RepID=UPI0010F759E7|nr:uncharacterized protein LOC114875223 [Osmia bicornis bicornis]